MSALWRRGWAHMRAEIVNAPNGSLEVRIYEGPCQAWTTWSRTMGDAKKEARRIYRIVRRSTKGPSFIDENGTWRRAS